MTNNDALQFALDELIVADRDEDQTDLRAALNLAFGILLGSDNITNGEKVAIVSEFSQLRTTSGYLMVQLSDSMKDLLNRAMN